jgi:hypothetical protein
MTIDNDQHLDDDPVEASTRPGWMRALIGDAGPIGIYGALARAQAEFVPIPKNKTATVPTKSGGEYSYDYADIADVLAEIRPKLAAQGIATIQRTEHRIGVDGGHYLITEFIHEDGSRVSSEWRLRAVDQPQDVGSELTYQRRYQASSLAGVAAEVDDDGARAQAAERPTNGGQRPARRASSGAPRDPDAETTAEQRASLIRKIQDVNEDVRRDFNAWMRENSLSINPRMTMQQLVDALRYLDGPDAVVPTEENTESFGLDPDHDHAHDFPNGDFDPDAPPADWDGAVEATEAEQTAAAHDAQEARFETPAPVSDVEAQKRSYIAATIESVKAMTQEEVVAALTARGATRTGNLATKQRRLAQLLIEEAFPPPSTDA